ncbi:MAG TPA: DUF3047 domain-containing protein [Rhodobacteraceae bacterium]|nr:DUF3047 domain-containing protein [Paracoccaceae bacterium]
MKTKQVFLAAAIAALAGPLAQADTLKFDRSWKEQGFLRLWTNDYGLEGRQLKVVSDGTVSLLWRSVPKSAWNAKMASWGWSVAKSVKPTDLTQKGGDDRNLAIYFVFVDPNDAKRLEGSSARRVLGNASTRALVYVWGGKYPRGKILNSPYGPGKLKTVISRAAGTGKFSEKVDLAADFKRAFGKAPGVLVGVAVSADSDDTDGMINAVVRDFKVF